MDSVMKRKCKDIKERKSQKVVARKYHCDYIKYGFI